MSMPMWALTEEKVAELERQMQDKKREHQQLEAKGPPQLWKEDLDAFEAALTEHEEKEEKERLALPAGAK